MFKDVSSISCLILTAPAIEGNVERILTAIQGFRAT
jgi:hypothetical protein